MNNSENILKMLKDYIDNNRELLSESFRQHDTQPSVALNPLEDWLDSQDVMSQLHICRRTLHTFRRNGTLPYSQLGSKLYYKRSDIQRILHDNYTMYKLRNENK